MLDNIELYLDAVDQQDSRDYIYEDIYMSDYWDWKRKSSMWDKKDMKVYNQFHQKTTYKACTCYGLWSIYNWNNVQEYNSKWFNYKEEDPKHKRHAYQTMRWRPNVWSSLQNMMKYYIKNKRIEWYMRAKTLEWVKNAIDNWFLIYTWTNKCNWRKAGSKWEFVYDKKWGWHCFAIIWYNKDWLIAVNSFWTDRWNDWYFTIKYEHFKYLYSMNVIVDKDDSWILNNLKYENEFKKAIELWITNGSDADKPATKKQVSVMIYRSLQLRKK